MVYNYSILKTKRDYEMTEKYEIVPCDSIEEMAKTGYMSFNTSVVGFWSNSVITSYIKRDRKGNWVAQFSNSSGGRDEKVCDEIEAYRNYATALSATVDYLESVLSNKDMLESLFQEKMKSYGV
jgi:hypothetical protein